MQNNIENAKFQLEKIQTEMFDFNKCKNIEVLNEEFLLHQKNRGSPSLEINDNNNNKILDETLLTPPSSSEFNRINSLSAPLFSDNDIKFNYNPFSIQKVQKYNPIYSLFLDVSKEEFENISLNQHFEIIDLDKVKNNRMNEIQKKSIFFKYSPLLDPTRYMIGKYNTEDESIRTFPSLENECHPKIQNVHNASYVDAFFCYLSSQILHTHHFLNAIDYYGSYLGLQEKFKINITDDLEYLNNSTFFLNNLGKLFHITENEESFMNYGSHKNKQKIIINKSEKQLLDFEEIECFVLDEPKETVDFEDDKDEVVYENIKNNHSSSNTSHTSSESSDNSKTNYTTDEDEGEEEDDEDDADEESSEDEIDAEEEDDTDDSDEEETQIYAYINDFPIQIINLEKCDGTIDELFSNGEMDEKEGASALFQVIMSLIIFQKAFNFTHNDLHTNNIMYKKTEIKYLYYVYENKKYKVPTYGKIFKIIDFGRSIYTFQNKILCSDSFAINGDASTQYNFEPFYNEKKPMIEPNYSFDLCRLGCSIYDFIIDDEDDIEFENMDELQKTVYRWCLDDNHKNVLYKNNGEERYPNFKLYKMIARTVHNHTPQEQLKYPFFNQYLCKNIGEEDLKKEPIMNIDKIPSYA